MRHNEENDTVILSGEMFRQMLKQIADFREALEYCASPYQQKHLVKRELIGEAAKRMQTAKFTLADYPTRVRHPQITKGKKVLDRVEQCASISSTE